MAQGDPSALGAGRAAHDLNPYDIDVQRALTTLYGRAGKAEAAARHLRYVRLLETGGAVAGASASSPR
jgi:hypothetical protein